MQSGSYTTKKHSYSLHCMETATEQMQADVWKRKVANIVQQMILPII